MVRTNPETIRAGCCQGLAEALQLSVDLSEPLSNPPNSRLNIDLRRVRRG